MTEEATPRIVRRAGAGSNLPAENLADKLRAEIAEMNKRVAAPTGDRIRYSGNKAFVAPDGTEGPELEVIVLDFLSTNLYYDSPYDSGNPRPPACFAIGQEPNNLVPSVNSPDKQAESCAKCPQNQFGSAIVGKGKACKNTRLVAVVAAAGDENSPIMIMSIPPTSLKTFDGYVSGAMRKYGLPPIGVVTKVTLDPNSTYASPRFEAIRALENEELAAAVARRDEATSRLIAEPDVSQYEPPKRRGR